MSKLLRCCFPCYRRRSHLPPLKTVIDFENLVPDIYEYDKPGRLSQYPPEHENIYDTLENAISTMATAKIIDMPNKLDRPDEDLDEELERIIDVEINTFGTRRPPDKPPRNIKKKSYMEVTKPISNECLHVINEEPTHYYWSPEERKID